MRPLGIRSFLKVRGLGHSYLGVQSGPATALTAGDQSLLVLTMKKFRQKRIPSRSLTRQHFRVTAIWPTRHGRPDGAERPLYTDGPLLLTRELEAQWTALHRLCTDRGSRTRLARLIGRLTGNDRGTQESALAELELATLLVRVGFSVRFLPESQSRTADLECCLGQDRFFVEVTAMIGPTHRLPLDRTTRARQLDDVEDGGEGHALIYRLVARVSQKARQLVGYCTPVLLAITVPHREGQRDGLGNGKGEELDLQQLASAVTMMLPLVPQISAVLLSLWDVRPLPARSGVRLANVQVVQRSPQQTAYPRVRLLILNPAAGYPLGAPQVKALWGLL